MQLTRREALTVLAGTGLLGKADLAMADTPSPPPAYRGDHQPKALRFDPAKLRGLSEKLLRSHHENNYTGAVKRLNLIQQQLGQLPKTSRATSTDTCGNTWVISQAGRQTSSAALASRRPGRRWCTTLTTTAGTT